MADPAAEIVAARRAGLGGLDATQHLVADHLVEVEGDRAACTAQFQATHVLADPAVNPTAAPPGPWAATTATGWSAREVPGASPR